MGSFNCRQGVIVIVVAQYLAAIDHFNWNKLIYEADINFEPIIGQTIEALAELEPEVVVPAHCTGWKAQHALAARMPEAFRPNVVGARFEL